MKAFLMYRDRDFDPKVELPANEPFLTQDLELNTLFYAMGRGDKFLFEISRKAVLAGLKDKDTIIYRQDILKDCLINSSVVKEIYDLARESIEKKKKEHYWFLGNYINPSIVLHSSVRIMQMFLDYLKKLKNIAEEHSDKFKSVGFTRFFAMLKKELSDEYLTSVQDHLHELEFRNGILMSAELGRGNKGVNYVLHKNRDRKQSWLARIVARRAPAYTFRIPPRDEAGARALGDLRVRGINLVANALGQSADHILNFFDMLKTELAFYIGCLNLHEVLAAKGEPTCFPQPLAAGERGTRFQGLYDVCLTLRLDQRVVGNNINADGKDLVIITGANQGGKSTFLRSLGLAQLMMQCDMFVPAESFTAD